MSNNEFNSISKMHLINERWQEIQVSIDREKNYRVQSVEEQMAALDDRITHSKAYSQQKLLLLKEKVGKVKESVQQLQERKTEVEQAVGKKLEKVEEGLIREVEKEKNTRNEYIQGWIKKSDEKLLDVCNSMEAITAEKGETV